MVGKTLSHYKVLEKIGQGGMGEVYRAEDTSLKRDVAIKVLPEQFTKDPQRLARFEREAQLLAQLNHPNIAAIYGFEEADDVRFLAMELVPGETLAERVAKGPVPVKEALEVCRQIAEGVEAAHDKGVIHRDLKPANVKVTPEGKVKILDFGLAKAYEAESPVTDISQSPTLTEEMTRAGVILGTAAYMSPEQARGKPVDKRSDVFAFGCVLYELLTGKRAFGGETVTDTLAKILEGEPDWNVISQTVPSTIRFLLGRCLQKDPGKRLQHIDGARILIEEALTGSTTVSPILGAIQAPLWKRALPWSLAGLMALITGLALWNLRSTVPTPSTPRLQPAVRLVVDLPVREVLSGMTRPALALSPDDNHLAFVATRGDTEQLYLHSMDRPEAEPIPETEYAVHPFFSPNSQWLGFFAGGKLKKVSVSGGSPVVLSEVASPYTTVSWDSDETIVLTRHAASIISRVPAAGGTPEPLTSMENEESGHWSPQILPGGKGLLFTVDVSGDSHTVVQSLETNERKVVLRGIADAQYVPTGHLVYPQNGTLMAVVFDLEKLEVDSAPVPILQDVMQPSGPHPGTHLTFSHTGDLVYVSDVGREMGNTLVWVDRQGGEQLLSAPPRVYSQPRLSPDGQRLSVQIIDPQIDIWVYDIRRDTWTRLTFQEGVNPLWTPDGKWITFQSNRSGPRSLFRKPADGTGAAEQFLTTGYALTPHSWSPDGTALAFTEVHPTTSGDIWVLSLGEGERKPQPLIQTPFAETGAVFSPDGHWLAYRSSESGGQEIYVQPYPTTGAKWQISTGGGDEAQWAHSGEELFYRSGDKMMAVEIKTNPTFIAGTPKLLFEGSYVRYGPRANYDVTLNGQRFLMIKKSDQESTVSQLEVIQNWFEELKRLVPTP